MAKQVRSNKPKLPKRLCRDPHTQYCKGEYRHRGCCNCFEVNAGEEAWLDWIPGTRIAAPCTPYNLPEYWVEQGWDVDEMRMY